MTQTTQDLTINKLIILFLLKNIQYNITQTQLTEFILYKNYTDYFSLQQYLTELVNAKLINKEKKNNTTFYFINQKGSITLDLFINRIPYSIREDIIEFSKQDSFSINLFTAIEANIKKIENNLFEINCFIKENEKTIIELNIKTTDEDEAQCIKKNWQKRARSLYKTIVGDLKKR